MVQHTDSSGRWRQGVWTGPQMVLEGLPCEQASKPCVRQNTIIGTSDMSCVGIEPTHLGTIHNPYNTLPMMNTSNLIFQLFV